MQGPVPWGSGQDRPSETLPLTDGSLSLSEGKGLTQSHTACHGICVSLAGCLFLSCPRGSGASPLGKIQGTKPPKGQIRMGDPNWVQGDCVSPAVLCSQGVRKQQLGDPTGLQGRGRRVRVHGSQQGRGRASQGPDRRHRSVSVGPSVGLLPTPFLLFPHRISSQGVFICRELTSQPAAGHCRSSGLAVHTATRPTGAVPPRNGLWVSEEEG